MPTFEKCKDVVGYEGHYVVNRSGTVFRVSTGRGLKPGINSRGYAVVTLCRKGKRATKRVSRIVAEAFLGPCPAGMEVCHDNGKPTDNALTNLRYDTPKGNNADKRVHGTHIQGEKCLTAKLTEQQAKVVKQELSLGVRTQKEIATDYGLTHQAVSRIARGQTWKHV